MTDQNEYADDEGCLQWIASTEQCPDCAKAEAESKARRQGGYLSALKLLLAIERKPPTVDRGDKNGE